MTEPPLELLASRRFPDVARALRAAVDSIIPGWGQLVRDRMPRTDTLTPTQLDDSLPEVLEQIAVALESDQAPEVRFLGDMTAEHGIVRFNQNFNLAEVLQEYSLLRGVLFREIRARLGRDVSVDEANALNATMDVSVRRAVLTFVDYQSRQLQSATEAQSKYLSFLSHDLRGGLNGVFLMIEVLKRELANEPRLAETVEDLDVMRRSLLETVGTMDRFLHAERFRKGKVQVRPGTLNLRNVMTEIAAHFSYQARDRGLEIRVEVPGECTVVSDRELLSMIFQNLVSNAIKYAGKGAIHIEGTPVDVNGCLLAVRDDGPGIAQEKLSQLFAPFSRGETYGQPGVGLGLSIARQAAEYIGAKLWAESKLGHGSTFFVHIPKELKAKA
jgi:signal transduction histidine kinase